MIFGKSGDLEFIKKINNSEFAGYIHSIFNKVINIYNTFDDEIYTLACKAMDNGPNTMVLDINEFTSFSLELDDKIFVKNDLLYIEDKVTISIENIVAWTCCLPPYPFNTNILRNNLLYTKKYIDNYNEYKGRHIIEENNLFIKQANIMLNERVEILKEKLFEGEHNIVKYASDLVGLGIGLTPSGDDFLVGLFMLGIGLAILQSAANPYITIVGPRESAAKRLSIVGTGNKSGRVYQIFVHSGR